MTYYTAEVLADSISPAGVRLTSIALKYPHAVHKDMLRHRNQSRVVESFRARPTELLIDALENGDAFRPEEFAERVAGMQQGDAVSDQGRANQLWDNHIENCLFTAREMGKLDIAKQQRNFVLQDLCPLVEIVTATDWDNFLALRTDVDENGRPRPRPEVYKTALAIQDALGDSDPEPLEYGQWHLPLIDPLERELIGDKMQDGTIITPEILALISAGRCARVSYDKHRDPEPFEKSIARAEQLQKSGHMSPFEQVARPMVLPHDLHDIGDGILIPSSEFLGAVTKGANLDPAKCWAGNFRGWVQLRKTIKHEENYGKLLEAASA